MKGLTKEHAFKKQVCISFNIDEKDEASTSFYDTINKRPIQKKNMPSLIMSQKEVNQMFDTDSLVKLTLNAKINNIDRYKGWNILQQVSNQNNFDSDGNCREETGVGEIQLSNAMKKYHELPFTLPRNQFTDVAIQSVIFILTTHSDKYLKNILTKEEILDTLTLCNYLGLKVFPN